MSNLDIGLGVLLGAFIVIVTPFLSGVLTRLLEDYAKRAQGDYVEAVRRTVGVSNSLDIAAARMGFSDPAELEGILVQGFRLMQASGKSATEVANVLRKLSEEEMKKFLPDPKEIEAA